MKSMARRIMVAVEFPLLICGLIASRFAFSQNENVHLAPGMLLVASEKLGDPNFEKTVVLILHRDPDGGTMGVVLNRPLDVTLAKAFPQLHGSSDPAYEGGPVSPEGVQALLRAQEKPENADHVIGDIYSVSRKALLEKSITDRLSSSKFRVYLGYAGWGPGQLESEMRMGAWATFRGAKYIFDANPASLWQRLNRDTHSEVAQTWHGLGQRAQVTMEACRCFEPLLLQ